MQCIRLQIVGAKLDRILERHKVAYLLYYCIVMKFKVINNNRYFIMEKFFKKWEIKISVYFIVRITFLIELWYKTDFFSSIAFLNGREISSLGWSIVPERFVQLRNDHIITRPSIIFLSRHMRLQARTSALRHWCCFVLMIN